MTGYGSNLRTKSRSDVRQHNLLTYPIYCVYIIYLYQQHNMFVEKELKILNIEYAVLTHHLEALWAKKTEPSMIRDRYYDTQDSLLRNKNQRLRLRSQGNTTVITQKTKIPNKKMKTMTEQDITIESPKKWHQLLQELGLESVKYKEKTRVSYQLDDMHFDIDSYDDIPTLLEIEWPTLEKILYRTHRLGLQYHMQVKWGSNKLFRHYKKPKSSSKSQYDKTR